MAKIDVISSTIVRMSQVRDGISNSNMDLTPWDLQLILLDPIQKGVLFHKPNESQDFEKTVIHHLKTSLSRTLDFFPPLAGRLGTVKNPDNTVSYFIDCNNAGVEFTHTVAHAVSVSDIVEPNYIPKIVSSFFPLNGIPNYEGVCKPLLGVQVTELVDGFFIGLTANHSIVDGTSFWHFINSWAEISRGLDTISKNPTFEGWFPTNISKDNNNLPIHLPPFDQNLSRDFVPPPLLERVFSFSKENLAKLRSKANSEAGTDKISTLQALSAHLLQSIVRCSHKNSCNLNNQQLVQFLIIIGTRARMPLADGYFGNGVHFARFKTSEHELINNGLGYVAKEINELINRETKEEIIKFAEEWANNPIVVRKGSFNFVLSSSPRHNVYGSDFGWGKPIAVRSGKAQKVDGKMTVFPAAEPGGIDVEVCLAPQRLQAIENDADFMNVVTI
ncbi:hypothetical protein BUALT_Bualt07G0062900 [Buddleja alternifolia]|uniref:Uncharacterized protein n=1 Tax=Buddleja alternifolia TaxID=168488 RepID=A0AAV6XA16_9LAMI|nr:hypothetical protein BUALT_Bualt07G0062900 [Buddleja alternifolia]